MSQQKQYRNRQGGPARELIKYFLLKNQKWVWAKEIPPEILSEALGIQVPKEKKKDIQRVLSKVKLQLQARLSSQDNTINLMNESAVPQIQLEFREKLKNKIHQEEDKDLDFDEEEGSLFYDRS
jgi:hypothetical protein